MDENRYAAVLARLYVLSVRPATCRDLCKIPIFGTFLRNALLERLKIFQYSLRVLRCCCFELCSKLRFCKGLLPLFTIYMPTRFQTALNRKTMFRVFSLYVSAISHRNWFRKNLFSGCLKIFIKYLQYFYRFFTLLSHNRLSYISGRLNNAV